MAIQMNSENFGDCKRFSAIFVAEWRQLTVAAILGVTLAACAGLGGITKDSSEEAKKAAVTKRAQERWDLIIAGKITPVYEMMSAGSKARMNEEDFRRRARLSGFKEAKVEAVTCEPDLCKVEVRTTLDHRLMKGLPFQVSETWVLEKGEYWYVWPL